MGYFVIYSPVHKKFISVRPANSKFGAKGAFDGACIGPWPHNHAATIDRDLYEPGYYPGAIVRKEAHESTNKHGIATIRRPDYDLEFDGDEVHYYRKQRPFVEYTHEYKQFWYTRAELVAFIHEVYRCEVETLGWEIWPMTGTPVATTTTVVFQHTPAVDIFA